MTTELLKEYFTPERVKCLNKSGIEQQAGIPAKTLDHFITGRRTISQEQTDKVVAVLQKLAIEPGKAAIIPATVQAKPKETTVEALKQLKEPAKPVQQPEKKMSMAEYLRLNK